MNSLVDKIDNVLEERNSVDELAGKIMSMLDGSSDYSSFSGGLQRRLNKK